MSMNRQTSIPILTRVLAASFALTVALCVSCAPNSDDQKDGRTPEEEMAFIRKGLRDHLRNWINPNSKNPWAEYYALRLSEAIKHVESQQMLEEPYVLFCRLGRSSLDPNEESVKFLFRWIEDGFKSNGIRIRCVDDDASDVIEVPFPPYMWDDGAKAHYFENPERDFSMRGRINKDHVVLEIRGKNESGETELYSTFTLSSPKLIESTYVVSVYMNDDSECEPLELSIALDLKQRIQRILCD